MSVEMDLQALVMGSERLLSHIARPDGIPRLNKSLAEIVSDTPAKPLQALSMRVVRETRPRSYEHNARGNETQGGLPRGRQRAPK